MTKAPRIQRPPCGRPNGAAPRSEPELPAGEAGINVVTSVLAGGNYWLGAPGSSRRRVKTQRHVTENRAGVRRKLLLWAGLEVSDPAF